MVTLIFVEKQYDHQNWEKIIWTWIIGFKTVSNICILPKINPFQEVCDKELFWYLFKLFKFTPSIYCERNKHFEFVCICDTLQTLLFSLAASSRDDANINVCLRLDEVQTPPVTMDHGTKLALFKCVSDCWLLMWCASKRSSSV